MKKLIIIVVSVITVFVLAACQNQNEHPNFEFRWALGSQYSTPQVFEDGYEVTSYHGNQSIVTIPSTFKGKAVRYIGENVFKNNEKVTKIILPKTMVAFGNNAFEGTINLTEIEVQDSEGEYLLSRDGLLYVKENLEENDSLILAYVPLGRTKDIVIESDVTRMNGFIFNGVYGLEKIIINKDSTLNYISKLFTNFVLDSNYKLKKILVDENQFNAIVALFEVRNSDLVYLISTKS